MRFLHVTAQKLDRVSHLKAQRAFSDAKTTQIYAKANLEVKRKALEKISEPSIVQTLPCCSRTRIFLTGSAPSNSSQGQACMTILTRAPPANRGYYAESSEARALTTGDLGHQLHIFTFRRYCRKCAAAHFSHIVEVMLREVAPSSRAHSLVDSPARHQLTRRWTRANWAARTHRPLTSPHLRCDRGGSLNKTKPAAVLAAPVRSVQFLLSSLADPSDAAAA